MSARDEVLAAVHRALARPGAEALARPGAEALGRPGPEGVAARDSGGSTGHAADGVVPRAYRGVTGGAGAEADVEVLVDRLLDYRASVRRCAPAELAATIAGELAGCGTVVVPPGLDAAWLGQLAAAGVDVAQDDPDAPLDHAALDRAGAALTACRVAIAATGTIVLDAAPDQGRRALTLLPDRHVCVVRVDQVVPGVPDGVAVLAAHPERPLTWISGPSATSDIELVRVEGVHGPRDLRVVVVG